jgi:hypothetical protein
MTVAARNDAGAAARVDVEDDGIAYMASRLDFAWKRRCKEARQSSAWHEIGAGWPTVAGRRGLTWQMS